MDRVEIDSEDGPGPLTVDLGGQSPKWKGLVEKKPFWRNGNLGTDVTKSPKSQERGFRDLAPRAGAGLVEVEDAVAPSDTRPPVLPEEAGQEAMMSDGGRKGRGCIH